MRPRTSLRRHRLLASVLAAGLVVGLTASGGGAGAQSVESLRDKAARVAAELDRLQSESDLLNEQYLQTQEDVAELQAEQAANAAAVADAQERLDTTRAEAAGYMVEAYVGAGAHDQVSFGSSDPNEAVNQQVLLEVLQGDRVQMSDGIAADKQDLELLARQLEESDAALDARQREQAEIVDQLESSVDQQQELLDSTKGELEAAVKAEQERAAAAAAAAAQAAADARRAAEQAEATRVATAQAGARAQRTTTTAPRSSGGSSAPAPAPAAPAPAPAPLPASPSNSGAAGAIEAAMTRLGTPYRWGGTTPAGFDCSGLMLWSWAQVGVSLPRTSGAQRSGTQRITADQLQPGDLVFTGSPVSHVGMYIGGGQMIHSPHTGDVVKISPVRMGSSISYGRVG